MRKFTKNGIPVERMEFDGMEITGSPDSDLVKGYLSKKYFGEGMDDDALQAAQERATENRQMADVAHGAATIGAAFGGFRPDDSFYEGLRKGADDEVRNIEARRKGKMDEIRFGKELQAADLAERKMVKENELSDPMSPQSQVFQRAIKAAAPGMFTDEELKSVSAADKDRILSLAQLKETIASRKQTAALAAGEKRRLADEKRTATVREIQERANNIETNISKLENMIRESGTYELMGSHNQVLDGLVETIATDMAKLQDPESVARPGEVALVKRSLIQSGFKNRNSTALDILDKFRNQIRDRVDNAYSVRNLPKPAERTAAPPAGRGSPPPAPKPGTIEGNMVFKGGDPSKPENWIEVSNE